MAKTMEVSNSVTINKSNQEVFDYLKYSKNQGEFSVWNMLDPDQKRTYKGEDGTVGFIYSWDSKNKNVGAGSQEIKKIVDGERIEYELRFVRPMKNIANSQFIIKKKSDTESEVFWDFQGPMKFPMSLFSGMFKKMMNKDMSQSLANLKEKLEG